MKNISEDLNLVLNKKVDESMKIKGQLINSFLRDLIISFIINIFIWNFLFSYGGNYYILGYYLITFLLSINKNTPFNTNLIFIFIASPLIVMLKILVFIQMKIYRLC